MDSALGIDTPQIGALVGVAQLAAVPIALSTPLIVARWGSSSLLLWGTAGTAFTLMPLALVPHWAAAGIGFTATIALASLVRPAFMMYTMEVVSARWRTAMSGSGTFSVGLSWAITAFGGGLLISYVSFRAMFLSAALLTLLGAATFWLHLRQRKK
jgi:predicted MFS family arabinose efflux permease